MYVPTLTTCRPWRGRSQSKAVTDITAKANSQCRPEDVRCWQASDSHMDLYIPPTPCPPPGRPTLPRAARRDVGLPSNPLGVGVNVPCLAHRQLKRLGSETPARRAANIRPHPETPPYQDSIPREACMHGQLTLRHVPSPMAPPSYPTVAAGPAGRARGVRVGMRHLARKWPRWAL
jgi:hypothetical protein